MTPGVQFSVPNGMSVLGHSRLCAVTCPVSPVVNAEAWIPGPPSAQPPSSNDKSLSPVAHTSVE